MSRPIEIDYEEVLYELGQEKIIASHDRLIIAELIRRLESVSPDVVERLYAGGYLTTEPSALIDSSTRLLKDGLSLMATSSELKSGRERFMVEAQENHGK